MGETGTKKIFVGMDIRANGTSERYIAPKEEPALAPPPLRHAFLTG